MKFQAAILALEAFRRVGGSAPDMFGNLQNVPDKAFKDIPQLAKKDRRSRARLADKLSKVAKPVESRNLNNGNDDGNGAQYQNYWNKNMEAEDFGFDIYSYSLKFTGCHAVTGFNEEVAAEENFDTVLGTQSYVTFRLCQTDQCQGSEGYSYGCTEDYGEYMIDLDAYVEALTNYRLEKKESFCEYCEICAAMKGYKDWNTMMVGSIQALVTNAEAQFEQWMGNYAYNNAYNNGGYYGGNYGGNYEENQGYDEEFRTQGEIDYWKTAQNNYQAAGDQDNMYGAYGNQYGNGNNGMNLDEVFGGYAKYWNYQEESDYQQNDYQESQAWASINSNFYSYCGRPVLNGFFDEYGDFIQAWGYFDADGEYQSLENIEVVVWDEDCHGKMPNGWENVMGNDPAEFQECDYQYSQSCKTNYLECQCTLYYDDMEELYQQLSANANANNNGNGNDDAHDDVIYGSGTKVSKFEQAFEKQEAELLYTQALTCQRVEYYDQNQDLQENTYTNQLNYQQLYEQKQAYQQAMNECQQYDDYDTCIYAVQAQIDADISYNQWIIKSAWDKYANLQALNAQYYVGAYCSDSEHIGLKVFSDENCAVPHPSATVEDLLGNIELGYDLVTTDCIPCHDVSTLIYVFHPTKLGNLSHH